MAKQFDPYHKWLGIAPEERLPTHYRLLGLNLFESDPDVIEAAADRQMTYLQEVSQGSEMEQAQKLLTEVAEARLCLLNQEKKAIYDARLREQLSAIEGGQRLRQQPKSANVSAKPKSQNKSVNVNEQSRLLARKKKATASSTAARQTKPQKQKQDQQPDAVADAAPTSAPAIQRGNRNKIYMALAGGAVLLFVGAAFLLLGGDSATESPPATAQKSANETPQPRPVEIPSIGSGRKVTVELDSAPKKENQPPGSSSGAGAEEEKETPVKDPVADELEEEDDVSTDAGDANAGEDSFLGDAEEKETPSGVKMPLSLIPLEISPKDAKTKFVYSKQPDGYYAAEGSTSAYYRMQVHGTSGLLSGLCLEISGPEFQSANLTNIKMKSADWAGAADSLGQGGAASVVDELENEGWQLQFNGGQPIWAVFAAKQPFKPEFLIEFKHESNAQRLPKFRLLGITGSGTAEEMAQTMRDRTLAEKPFANFIVHGLPEGGTGEAGLGQVFVGAERLVVELFGGSSSGSAARFTLKEVPLQDEQAVQRWEFVLVADDQAKPVAELVLQGEKQADLTLRWLPLAAKLPRAMGLQNALLQLQIGSHLRNVPLREVRQQVPLTYSPKKTVRPRIEVPAGVPAEELRLALQFPATSFGTGSTVVLPVGGEEAEAEVTIKDDLLLKLATSSKSSEITLTVKTFLPVKEVAKKKSDTPKTKLMLFSSGMKEIPKLKKRYEDSKPVIAFIEKMEKFAGRTYLRKPEDKRDWMRISKQWYGMGLPPPKRIDPEIAKQLLSNAQTAQAAIKKDLDTLEGLQVWSKTFGQEGTTAIEFRVFTLIDGLPLELVRSTGWQD